MLLSCVATVLYLVIDQSLSLLYFYISFSHSVTVILYCLTTLISIAMTDPTRCGIMDILYVIDHDLAGRPLNTATTEAPCSTSPGVPQPQEEIPFALPSNEPFPANATQSSPPSPASHDDGTSDYARSTSTDLMFPSHPPLYPSIASSSPNREESSSGSVHGFPPSNCTSKTKHKLHGVKQYWTEAELVKKCSADGRKHWKIISSQMSRSPEACRTRWKILAKDLRTFSAEEEGILKDLLNE